MWLKLPQHSMVTLRLPQKRLGVIWCLCWKMTRSVQLCAAVEVQLPIDFWKACQLTNEATRKG